MANPLEKEFRFYLDHQDELVEKYEGKVIVIKDLAVIGVYDSEFEAVTETSQTEEMGTFIVQRCEPGPESHTQMFHSRVVFA